MLHKEASSSVRSKNYVCRSNTTKQRVNECSNYSRMYAYVFKLGQKGEVVECDRQQCEDKRNGKTRFANAGAISPER